MIDQAWQQGAVDPAHLVSDGDPAIAAGLGLVYGRPAPRQLCQLHLRRECRRNIGGAGWRTAACRLRAAESVAEAQRWAPRVIALSGSDQSNHLKRNATRQILVTLTAAGADAYTAAINRAARTLCRNPDHGS